MATKDCLEWLPGLEAESVNCCVTSPPYWGLRDYGVDGQLGLEKTPEEYVERMVGVFREVRRVLRDDGTLWLNLGDSYASGDLNTVHRGAVDSPKKHLQQDSKVSLQSGLKPKDLVGIPWRVAFALQADGWYLRSDIIWHKPNPMPESVRDRPTKAHEYIFLLTKKARYFYDADAVREPHARDWDPATNGGSIGNRGSNWHADAKGKERGPHLLPAQKNPLGRNRRTVWTVSTKPFKGAHFATFPPDLIEPCILAGTPHKVCAECGAPWVREVERGELVADDGGKVRSLVNPLTRDKSLSAWTRPGGKVEMVRPNHHRETRTLGFSPTCSCGGETVPGVVMDPFAGAGTTGMVALKHGRRFLGCELNAEYAAMAEERLKPYLEQPVLA